MIVAQSEITLIKLGRRRQMMLPMARGELGELLPCPVEVGELLRLQTKPFEKGTRLTVIAIEVARVCDLTDDQAERQGYRSAAALRDAWRREHSISDVWILSFARGDHCAFFRDNAELYLKAKGVGLTRDPNKGVRTEPAVTTEEQLALAARARERSDLEERRQLGELGRELESLMRTSSDPLRKRMLKRSIRNLQSLLKVPSDASLESHAAAAVGVGRSTTRPPDGISSPSRKAA